MCAGALVHVRMRRVILVARSPGGRGWRCVELVQLPTLNHRCEITSGFCVKSAPVFCKLSFRQGEDVTFQRSDASGVSHGR